MARVSPPDPLASITRLDKMLNRFMRWTQDITSAVNGGEWVDVTFENSWVNYGAGFSNVQYRMIGNNVELRGLVKDGTVGSGTPIFTLPEGFRPVEREAFSIMSNNLFGRVDVFADGKVSVLVGNNAYVSLSGIRFSLD